MSTATQAGRPPGPPSNAQPHSRRAVRRPGLLARHLPERPKVNITGRERLARVLLGVLGLIWGALLLAGAASAAPAALEALLVADGADLVVTGALGHCPLYAKLGHVPRSLRAEASARVQA